MANTSRIDPFRKHNEIDQEMIELQREIRKLCEQGHFDEAIERSDNELRPIHEKWLETLQQSLITAKKISNS